MADPKQVAAEQRTYLYVKSGQTLKGYPEGSCFKAERKSKNKKYSIALTYPFAAQAAYAADVFNSNPIVVANNGLAKANFLGLDAATEALAWEVQVNCQRVGISDIEELRVRAGNELAEVAKDVTSRISKKYAILQAQEDPAGSVDATITPGAGQDRNANISPGMQSLAANKQAAAKAQPTAKKLLQPNLRADAVSTPVHNDRLVGTGIAKPLGLSDSVPANKQGSVSAAKARTAGPSDLQVKPESQSKADRSSKAINTTFQVKHDIHTVPTERLHGTNNLTTQQDETSSSPKTMNKEAAVLTEKAQQNTAFQLFTCDQRTGLATGVSHGVKQDHNLTCGVKLQPKCTLSELTATLQPIAALSSHPAAEIATERPSGLVDHVHDVHMVSPGDSEDQGWSPRYQAADEADEFYVKHAEDINNHAVDSATSDHPSIHHVEIERVQQSTSPFSVAVPARDLNISAHGHPEGNPSYTSIHVHQSMLQPQLDSPHVSACADALARAQSASQRSKRDVVERIESSLQKEYGKKWPPPMLTQQWDKINANVLSRIRDTPIQAIQNPSPELLSLLYVPRHILRALWILQCFHLRAHHAQQAAFSRNNSKNNNVTSTDVQRGIVTAMNIQPARGCMVLLRHPHGVTCRRVLRMYEGIGRELPNWYGLEEPLPQAIIELDGHVMVPLNERVLDCDLADLPPRVIAESITEYSKSALFEPVQFSSIVSTVQVMRAYCATIPHVCNALDNIKRMTKQALRNSNSQLRAAADSYRCINDLHSAFAADSELLDGLHRILFNCSLQDALNSVVLAQYECDSKETEEPGTGNPGCEGSPENGMREERVGRIGGRGYVVGSKRMLEEAVDWPSRKTQKGVHSTHPGKLVGAKRPNAGKSLLTWPDWPPEQETGIHDWDGNNLTWRELRALLQKRTCLNCFKRGHRRQDCWAPQKPYIDYGMFASEQ